MLKQRKKLIVLFFTLVVSLIGLEIFLDILLPGLSTGAPITQTGTISIKNVPETDVEFVSTAIELLQELDWWQGDPILLGLSRKIECFQVDNPPRNRLLNFRKANRITLFTENVHYATVKFSNDGTELSYRLENYRISKIQPTTGLNLAKVRIESKEALKLAEESGGKFLRELVNDECYIYMDIDKDQNWEVDYSQQNPFKRLLCLNIDSKSGKVKQIPERGFSPCQLK